MFISIFAASCRPNNIIGFLDNLAETAADTNSFEVLIKLDEDADEMISLLDEYQKHSKFTLKYLATAKLDGYYTLDVGYNELLKIVHPDSYFCWLLTDEIRLETKGWDTILKKYIHFFPDDIFRIKLSIFQLKNYNDFFECLPCPDNYAVTTRKWLEVTGGWGNFWGPDSWHQCVDYYLGLCKNEFNPFGIWRSFPIFDIKVGGQEAGQGIEDPQALSKRAKKIFEGWRQHSTHAAQENFLRLAQRLNAHIYAQAKQISGFNIQDNTDQKLVSLYSNSNVLIKVWPYTLPGLRLQLRIAYKRMTLAQVFPFLMYAYRKYQRTRQVLHKTMNLPLDEMTRLERLVFYTAYVPARRCFKFYKKIKRIE